MSLVKRERHESFSSKRAISKRAQAKLPGPTLSTTADPEPTTPIEQEAVNDDELLTPVSNNHNEAENFSQANYAGQALLDTMDTQPDGDDMHAMGVHSRQLIQTIQKLETLNINATLPSLPKFVVVGDQSAGKSSIVEALCHVQVPRSAGTCTRCPFLITTTATKNGEWSCDVTLQFRYRYDATARGAYERWVEQSPVLINFATITEKSELAEVLQRAQLAVLNPRHSPQSYVSSALLNEPNQLMFSPNLICLAIKGPELPEFSFYDLPGCINVTDEENDDNDKYLVDFVEQLVKNYVQEDKTLVMLAVASDNDMENSTAFKFIRHVKAGPRCLGVLTKPDLMPPSKVDKVARLLKGDGYHLGRGWFVTKQPSQADLDNGITHAAARQMEAHFFSTGEWTSARFAPFAPQFGIPNIQNIVAEKLREHIIDNLDDIINRVERRLDAVEGELSCFREKDAHPMMTILNVVNSIGGAVGEQITGRSTEFRPGYEGIKLMFRDHLLSNAPEFDPSTPEHNATICIESDDDGEEPSPTPAAASRASAKRQAPVSTPTSTKRIKTETTSVKARAARFTISDVNRIRNTHASSVLPGQQSPDVTDKIIKESMASWSAVLEDTLERIGGHVQDMLLKILHDQLASFSSCELHQKTLGVGIAHVQSLVASQKQEARKLLAREQHKPMTTCNTESYKHATTIELSRKRNNKRILEHFEKQENAGAKPVSSEAKKKAMNDENMIKNLGHDPHKMAVEALILPFAYYKIAAGRFVDSVALLLESDLLHALQTQIKDVLIEGLGASDAATCDRLLLEDANQERERQRLLGERSRLQAAMAELNNLR